MVGVSRRCPGKCYGVPRIVGASGVSLGPGEHEAEGIGRVGYSDRWSESCLGQQVENVDSSILSG